MEYCARCVYPVNARPAIILDEQGICSGCRYHESRQRIDWSQREAVLREMLEMYRRKAREQGLAYDCIIPVSGGKDSHYQTYLMKVVYGMNPLLVTFNHTFNTELGVRNLTNLVEKLGCDLIRVTANPQSVRKVSRYMTKKVGDITWHYHAGIRTVPFQVAVHHQIPLIVWGEHGFAELTGMFTLDDMVEFTKWTRQEHDMRGYEADDLINDESGITKADLAPYQYPTDEQIEEVGVRGIYLSNFIYWDAKQQAELMIAKYGFEPCRGGRERTFVLYTKTDDHANDVHDYMKYLKFGYGRATDDASMEVRHGRMTREQAIELAARYDSVRPSTLSTYLKFLEVSETEFHEWIDPMRDATIWERGEHCQWRASDSVANHRDDPQVEAARVPLVATEERTFAPQNRRLYHSDSDSSSVADQPGPPSPRGTGTDFIIL